MNVPELAGKVKDILMKLGDFVPKNLHDGIRLEKQGPV
jgi:hypothetical protein